MRWLAIVMLVLLSACSTQGWNERLSTPGEREMALQALEAVRSGNIASLRGVSETQLMDGLTPEIAAKIRSLLPPGEPRLLTVAQNSTTAFGGETKAYKSLFYELGSGNRWALAEVTLQQVANKTWLAGMHVVPFDHSPVAENAFTLEGKGTIHYVWIAAMAAAVLISLFAFVQILRTRGLKLKWLWAIGSLLSFVTFQLNWTTGETGFMPISFLVLGAGGFQVSPLMPWVLSFAIPAVALLFLALKAIGQFAPPYDADSD
jgi:hypothetical protein